MRLVAFAGLLTLALTGCTGAETGAPPEGQPLEDPAAAPAAEPAEVLETMDSGGYTYARLMTVEGEVWVAAPVTPLAVGDRVHFTGGMEMTDFHAPSLDRTFESIWFVGSLPKPGGAGSAAPAGGHAGAGGAGEAAPTVEAGSIARAEGGYTIAEIHADRAALGGQEIAVTGRVVKYNAGIMGKNWIHLQDGTGEAGTNDLTVTTLSSVAVGDQIVVRGVLTLDKDFGAGYRYDLIIEDASVSPAP